MITKRVQDKLTGRDFDNEAEPLDIDSQVLHRAAFPIVNAFTLAPQVARLISEAISEANLSQVRRLSFRSVLVLLSVGLTYSCAVLHWLVPVLVIKMAG